MGRLGTQRQSAAPSPSSLSLSVSMKKRQSGRRAVEAAEPSNPTRYVCQREAAGGESRPGMRVREGRRCLQRMPADEVLQTRAGTSPSKMRWSVNSSANVRRDMSSMREKRSDARAGCSDKPTRSRNQEAQPVGLVVVSERPASRHDPTRRSTATSSLTHFSGARTQRTGSSGTGAWATAAATAAAAASCRRRCSVQVQVVAVVVGRPH